jgi:hypothetical protein
MGQRYAGAAAAICGIALLILALRAGALRADAIETGSGLGSAVESGGAVLHSTLAQTGTVEPKAYFPIMARNWFEEYTVTENFEPPVAGWPQGSVWNAIDVHEEFNYGPFVDGDGSTVYQIGVKDNYDHVFLTGPLYALKNFEYEVWMRRLSAERDQLYEYGILISPTPIDPAHPYAEGVYTFQLRLGYGGIWLVKKWDVLSLDNHPGSEIAEGASAALTEGYKQWNQLRIRRVGDTLYFDATHGNTPPAPGAWANLASHTDPALPDQFYVGFYAAHAGVTMWRYYQYDNVYVHSYP